MIIHRKIKFVQHKRKVSSGTFSIIARVTVRGQTPLDFSLGISLPAEEWDSSSEMAMPSCQNAVSVNKVIAQFREVVEGTFTYFEIVENRMPERDELKDMIREKAGLVKKKKNENSFYSAYDTFLNTMSEQNQWAYTTVQKFLAIREHLHNYAPGLEMEQVNEDFLQGFLNHLVIMGMRNTSIAKQLEFIRWFLRWAIQHNLYNGTAHMFRPKLKGTDGNSKEIVYLTLDEIKQLSEHVFDKRQKHLEQVRDVLLFCCFTGLRYSDVKKLKKSDVHEGYIDVVTQKTADGLRIELNNHSRAILNKYRNIEMKDDAALPVISNAKMNEYLKDLGIECKIDAPVRRVYFVGNQRREDVMKKWQLLTTHVGRRTFVVTALQLGVPAEVIMKWTGHSDFSTMKPYIKIVDELKERNMSLFNKI